MSVRDTSKEVYYREVKPNLNQKQQMVLDAMRRLAKPVCNQEIAYSLNWQINTVTPRVNELVAKSIIKLAYKDIYPLTNRRVIYWTIATRSDV